ncbi:MAG: gamma-glutamyl-gamma-aminobutyrate hydrolase family protein, partial [Limosilactobacillus sp.]|nr:gamma-glutamyl-gamma-aminobutyrate hydrolase family protein [Limosilactobacillus sp.]
FGIHSNVDLGQWERIVATMKNFKYRTKIAVVGKYCHLEDAYKSLKEALTHAGIDQNTKIDIDWVDSEDLENKSESEIDQKLNGYHGILVPGGCGVQGTAGILTAIRYAREHKIPYFGICLGFQLAIIEALRNLAGESKADSTEFTPDCLPVITRMTITDHETSSDVTPDLTGDHSAKRLGADTCTIQSDSLAYQVYQTDTIHERHHNLYEMNREFIPTLNKQGVQISATSHHGQIPEIMEIPNHPFFLAVQFHPEYASKPCVPHPAFIAFVRATMKQAGIDLDQEPTE